MFNRIVTQLLNLKIKIEEKDNALFLLSYLPPSYEHLVTTLMYRKNTIEVGKVTAALLTNEIMKTSSEKSQAKVVFVSESNQGR